MNHVQKSCLELTKLLKMNIMKFSTKEDRSVDSFKIWFGHVGTIA